MKQSALLALALLAAILSEARAQNARQILDASGVQGGLVAVIGCDSPALLGELRSGNAYLVQGLDRDPAKIADAQTYLEDRGLYGPITATRWDGSRLPYVDNLVNLIVVTGDTGQISEDEMERVLAPLGVIADARNGKIEITRKPWPAELDEWSHFLHDASNNAVSKDTVAGPPRGLRWNCGPEYARSHEHFASMSAMVTSGGRIFYIIDAGPVGSVYLPPEWKLVARDAFSGVLLWQRPITNWESQLRGFRSGPPEIGRRLVAAGDRVHVTLGYGEPVTVLDAATGEQLATAAGTEGARELLLADDVLYVLADDMTAAQHEERKKWINQVSPRLEIWYRFPQKPVAMYGTQRIVALKTVSGEPIWKREFSAPGEIMPTTMAIDDGRICLQTVSHVVCLDAFAGKELWRKERPVARSRFSWSTPTLAIHDGVVLTVDRVASDNAGKSPPGRGSEWIISSGGFEDRQEAELAAFSLDDGKELWRAPYSENYNTPGDIFVIGGVVWVGNLRGGGDPGFTEGRDLKTGKIAATLPAQKAWGHHRCYRNKATVHWLMVGRGGIQFIDPNSGSVQGNSWVRGTCQYGTMPANGPIYAPQHSCACQPEEMLIGLNALAPRSSAGEGPAPIEKSPAPLEKGPAYDEIADFQSGSSKTAWPTYRRDLQRSGYQDLPAPAKPDVAWTRKLAAPITAPVVADGSVFVAETDLHALHALSAVNGKPAWTFVADGRIDSPPTLSGRLCLFGTRGGFVYCLRASDGALVWRFRAAPLDRRLFAYEQLESVWPVHGSVLVDEIHRDRSHAHQSVAYFAAGRSSRIDGGIRLYALDVKTGDVLHKADVNMTAGSGGPGVIRQSVLPDILSLQKETIWMRGLGVDRNLAPVDDLPHLFAQRGFLEDTWWHRTFWLYGTAMGGGYTGWPLAGNEVPAGRLLVFDGGELIYGYGRMAYREGGGHVRPDAAKDYRLFAEILAPQPQTQVDARGEKKQVPGRREIQWTAQLPFMARSVVLVRDALLVAGGESLTESAASHGPGTLWVISRENGSEKAACTLPAPPVLDGMALTGEGVFVSTIDGSVVCLQTTSDP
jgi:outer membrane protein assembly factor BamB